MLNKRTIAVCLVPLLVPLAGPGSAAPPIRDGKFLFEQETFSGNGRACLTCHSRETGTVSALDAQRRFAANRFDPLFRHDGSDDGKGRGFQRMLTEATILVEIPLPPNVTLADDPKARSVVVRRGIPSTINTPALDPVLMWDGREPNLAAQARNAILGHAQSPAPPSSEDLDAIARFQVSDQFFSSTAVRDYARGGVAPELPEGTTESEKRGRVFFEERIDPNNANVGVCGLCHSGSMLDRTSRLFPVPPVGRRFISVGVSETNDAKNPVHSFLFQLPNGSQQLIMSPDPGRALITGKIEDVNSFKITPLRGVRKTAPYFHDNSANTLEDVAAHYAKILPVFDKRINLTPQDQADIVAFMKLLE